jgi:hypothetical protein
MFDDSNKIVENIHLIAMKSPLRLCALACGGLALKSRTNAELRTNVGVQKIKLKK